MSTDEIRNVLIHVRTTTVVVVVLAGISAVEKGQRFHQSAVVKLPSPAHLLPCCSVIPFRGEV